MAAGAGRGRPLRRRFGATLVAAGSPRTSRADRIDRGIPGTPAQSALLAQLVEHFHGKEGVAGSSPAEGSCETAASRRFLYFGRRKSSGVAEHLRNTAPRRDESGSRHPGVFLEISRLASARRSVLTLRRGRVGGAAARSVLPRGPAVTRPPVRLVTPRVAGRRYVPVAAQSRSRATRRWPRSRARSPPPVRARRD